MEVLNKKCSSKDHVEIDAIIYYQECQVYMCNKCENFHSKLCQYHHIYTLDKSINDIFTGYCKEKRHNNELEYYCKTHDILCCDSCISKIKGKGKGQHKDCDICYIEDIKEDKKNKLKENIDYLKNISSTLEENINKLKILFEEIKENKEELKLKIQKIFTKIRNSINEREDKLLLEVDNKYNEIYFNENIIIENEKLPNKVKTSIEKGIIIEKEWDNNNKLSSIINDCINIENNIKDINIINEKMKNCDNSKKIKIKFFPTEELEFDLLEKIKNFGKLDSNLFLIDSLIIKQNFQYIENIIKWINSKNKLQSKLLYRKSKDGDSYDIFHKLCDNQGPTMILIKSTEGFIIGGYTPLDWDNHSGWKIDNETFLFSLSDNHIFKKKSLSIESIKCSKDLGPFFHCIGFIKKINNMNQGSFSFGCSNYENHDKIIPNESKSRTFDVEEVEVYKIFN